MTILDLLAFAAAPAVVFLLAVAVGLNARPRARPPVNPFWTGRE